MPITEEPQEIVADAARKVAELPVDRWAGWAVYFLEVLDGIHGRRIRPTWLDDIRDSLNDRITHGKW